MATVAVIQARLSSRRFPRKALADLEGHPLIWHVCTRVRDVAGLDRIILACPPCDREAFTSLNLPCEVLAPDVPEDDVLARFAAVTADLASEDWILRVTGDCPCWNPEVGRKLLDRAAEASTMRDDDWERPRWWFVTADTTCSGYADGEDAEVFPVALLRDAADYADWPLDREHVTRWMRRMTNTTIVMARDDRGSLKLSVDTPEDLTAVREYLSASHSTLTPEGA